MNNDGCEIAISKTGWGLCHYLIIGLCGLCSLAEAMASVVILVVTALLACDLKLMKNDVMLLNGISSLGMVFGGFIFGTLADTNGRKSCLPLTLVLIFCASIGLSFGQKLFPVSLAIFFLAIGIAGNNVTFRVYLIECLPSNRRGSCLAILDLLWIIGYLIALGLSWSLVPSIVRMFNNEFRPSSWRVLAALGGAPSLIMACAVSLLPSSPRYLLYRRFPERALVVLQQMYAINHSLHADNYPPCRLEGCVRTEDMNNDDNNGANSILKKFHKYIKKTGKRINIILRPPFTRITILATLSRTFLFPGFIWFAMWNVDIITSAQESRKLQSPILGVSSDNHYNSSLSSLSGLVASCTVEPSDIALGFLYNCHEANELRFQYSLLLSPASYIIGEVLLIIGIDVIGRRLSIGTCGLVGATAILALVFTNRKAPRILLSIIFLVSYSVINTTTSLLVMENYPTCVRGTVVGLTSVLPHLAAFFVKLFARALYCVESIYFATGLIIVSTLAALPLPDLTRAPMQE